MAVNFEKGLEEHSFWDFKGQTDYVDSWFLMGKPYLPLLIVVSYLVFVLRVGPAYMRRRPPVDLQNVLLVYNGWQVLMSSYLFSLGIRNIMRYGLFHKTCLFHHEDIRKDILTGSYWYIIAKVTELLETVFFVLRKKQSQVSFLHVYHHTFVVVMSWLMVKYAKTDDLVFVGTLNSFVHIWMYVYYGLSVFPQMARFLWWKKYLTSLQLIQFVLVMIQISINTVTSKCPPSSMVIGMALFNGFLFLYLFSDFYRKAYVKKGKTEAKAYKKNDPHINGLDSACNNFLKNSRNKWKR